MPKKGQKRKQRHEEEASDSEEVESQLLNAAPAEEDEDASDAHFEVAEYTQEEADVMARNFRKMEKITKTVRGFAKGVTILVEPEACPNTQDETLLWKAKIVEVRQKFKKLHFGINWYYRRADADALKIPAGSKFQPSSVCGTYELIESNHADILQEDCVIGQVKIVTLTDQPTQPPIGPDQFYCRSYAALPTGKGKSSSPKVHTAPCPLCNQHYRPDSNDLQNYCAGCGKWYHQHCLIKQDFSIDQDSFEKSLSTELRRNIPHGGLKDQKRQKRSSDASSTLKAAERKRAEKTIKRIAGQCITRGGEFGIAGEVRGICAARTILADLATRGVKLHEIQWEDLIGDTLLNKESEFEDEVSTCFQCPACEKFL